jgi:hypothetical protein
MKLLELSKEERRTLWEMGIFTHTRGRECGLKGFYG